MGYPINQNKLKRNKIMCRKPTNLRLNRNMICKAPCITEILPNGSWKDKTCFLLGGGPSLKNFDFGPLENKLTIGINKSFIKFPTTINYAMDDRFYKMVTGAKKGYAHNPKWEEIQKQWSAYRGIKLFLYHNVKCKFDENVYSVKKLANFRISFDLNIGIWGGNNSGFGALMLAIGLGATRIGLLGYDLKIQGKKSNPITHWHDGYAFDTSKQSFQRKLDKFKTCFDDFAKVIAKQGVKVVNLNLDSALECFSKEGIETFLK